MNKTDIAIVAALVLVLLAWLHFHRPAPRVRPPETAATGEIQVAESPAAEAEPPVRMPGPEPQSIVAAEAATEAPPAAAMPREPAQTALLSNSNVAVTVSSHGGAIVGVELRAYRATLAPDSGPVRLDFSAWPALSFVGAAFSTNTDFALEAGADGRSVRLTAASGHVLLERTIRLSDGYDLTVADAFANLAAEPQMRPAHGLACGPMTLMETRRSAGDYAYLGLDSLPAHGGEGVRYWMKSGFMRKSPVTALLYGEKSGAEDLPASVSLRDANPVSWVAAKNKFFVQVLACAEAASSGCELKVWRGGEPGKRPEVSAVAVAAWFPEWSLPPGESVTRTLSYYVGPKKYTLLRALGPHQGDIMEFGTWFGWICKLLLPTLNWIYALIPNYGIAIIILTVLVRIVFWPVTHKSTQDMKKMAAIQPLVAQLREKYKDKPQKLNQETMALYREHKVNPMSGCLPMLIQIPVFIALFTVLRSAVELRFAPFLWIRDLSEPEGLFHGARLFQLLPLVDSLNILPLLMTATTIWQQKLTPAAGDPQQQKMMMLMPVFMLFLFYNMAAALVLYWTTSQVLSIAQILLQRRVSRPKAPSAAGP